MKIKYKNKTYSYFIGKNNLIIKSNNGKTKLFKINLNNENNFLNFKLTSLLSDAFIHKQLIKKLLKDIHHETNNV